MPAFETTVQRTQAAEEILRLAGHVLCPDLSLDYKQARWRSPDGTPCLLKCITHTFDSMDEDGEFLAVSPYFLLQHHAVRIGGSIVHPLVDFDAEHANVTNHRAVTNEYRDELDMRDQPDWLVRNRAWDESMTSADELLQAWVQALQPVQLYLPTSEDLAPAA